MVCHQPLGYKLHEGRDICLLCSLLYAIGLGQFLTYSRHSKNCGIVIGNQFLVGANGS